MSLLNKYKNRYAGIHKPTTVRVYAALHAFVELPDGARPTVQTIANMADVSPRTVNTAVKVLVTEGLLRVEVRHDRHGRPLPNRYVLLTIATHKASSLDPQILADTAKSCAGVIPLEEVLVEEEVENLYPEEEQRLNHRTGLDTPTVCTVAHGSGGEQGHSVDGQDRKQILAHGTTAGKRANVFTDPGLRNTTSANSFSALDFKQPLADPALEQQSVEILERLDKLRVAKMHANPLTDGSRPGQLTSARYLVAFDRVDYDETLDLLEWLFSGVRGTKTWVTKVTKVYELRKHHSKLIAIYRKHLADGSWPPRAGDVVEELWVSPFEPRIRTEEESAELRRRLMAHKAS